MRHLRVGISLTVILAIALPAVSQEGAEPLWKMFADEVQLADVMEFWTSERGIGLEFDREKLDVPVEIRTGPGLTNEGFWALTNRMLVDRDLACVQIPGEENLSVVPLARAFDLSRVESNLKGAQAGYVKTVVDVGEGPGARPLLEALMTGSGSKMVALADTGQFIVAGLKPQVSQAVAGVDAIVAPENTSLVEEIELEHMLPIGLVSLSDRISAADKDGGALRGSLLSHPSGRSVLVVAPVTELPAWRARVAQLDVPEGLITRTYQVLRYGLEEVRQLIENVLATEQLPTQALRLKVVTDSLSGALIIRGSLSQHARVEELLTSLAGSDQRPRRALRAIGIKHRGVRELLATLQELLGGSGRDIVASDDAGLTAPVPVTEPTATGGRPPTYIGIPLDELTLTADLETNRILALGDVRWLDELEALVETLDVVHPQVMIETLVLNLSESSARDLGVELQKLSSSDGAEVLVSSLFGLGSPDATGAVLPPAQGTGFGGVLLDPRSFGAVVRALETLTEGRSLTIPKALVANNEEALLSSLFQTPYLSTNASNTVATTSLGGTLDAGTTISLRPQIADGDRLLLDYSVSVSAFVGDALDPALPPPRQESKLESTVTVPDGFTVALGGLEVETATESESRVPLLGSLPLVGALFRSRSVSKSNSRFFVFLRCSILRTRTLEGLRFVSDDEIRRAGLDPDLPVLEPRVIQ